MRTNLLNRELFLTLLLVVSLVIPVIFVFAFDLNYYFIPGKEFKDFYVFSIVYSFMAFILALGLRKYIFKSERSKVPGALRIALGILWLVDGVLQFQPQMPYGFLSVVLLPSIQAIPVSSIQSFLMIGYKIWETMPLQFDALSGAVQLFIGVSFLINKTIVGLRVTSWISILWVSLIWIFGEGLGGVPEAGVSLLNGFPGSSLIYLLMAVPYLSDRFYMPGFIKKYMKYSITTVFLAGAILQIMPGNTYWNSGQISYLVFQNIDIEGEPHVLSVVLPLFYQSLLFHESYLNEFFVLIFLISAGIVLMGLRRGIYVIFTFMLAVWVIFQDMGIYVLPSTDPNTGLPFSILIYIYALLLSHSLTQKTAHCQMTAQG